MKLKQNGRIDWILMLYLEKVCGKINIEEIDLPKKTWLFKAEAKEMEEPWKPIAASN